jgi:phosphate transport system substrate-binding protein
MRRFLVAAVVLALASFGAHAQEFDLDSLPPYKPEQKVVGVIRIHGNQLALNLVKSWEAGFMKQQEAIRFWDYLLTTSIAITGLVTGTADIGVMGHDIWRPDLNAFHRFFGYEPLEIMFASGSYDEGSTPGLVMFVNKQNPLSKLTLKQLDGILGAPRTGGWHGLDWKVEAARGADGNIRNWGQLGLTGEWADQPIHIFGIDATLSNWSGLVQKVAFQGGDKWNPALHEIVRGGVETPVDVEIANAVAKDRFALGFTFMKIVEKVPELKPIAIAAREGGPYIQPTKQTFYDRTYPLTNAVYIYLNRPPGKPLHPRVKGFLRYILSREGQKAVADDRTYLPLTAEAAREQLRKLE